MPDATPHINSSEALPPGLPSCLLPVGHHLLPLQLECLLVILQDGLITGGSFGTHYSEGDRDDLQEEKSFLSSGSYKRVFKKNTKIYVMSVTLPYIMAEMISTW